MTGKENTQMGYKGDWGDKRMKNEQEKREEATRDKAAEMERGERGQWANKTEFLLSMLGSMVGLGNVWRFPYLCYKNGGGVFLVPYVLLAVTCGVPLFLLESSIGQYTQQGLITCWRRLCPLAEGIGYGGLMVQLYSCVCYIIILAWALLYLIFSFSSQLPWASCTNTWNTASCIDLNTLNLTANWVHQSNNTNAATEFWEHRVLGISGGIEQVGSIRWELALCLFAMWITCYFCIWKGVKSTGKVWMEAGAQIFFSYSVGAGSLTVLGSYNAYNNNCYRDCWLCLLNSGTSFIAGFAVFSVLGFMAHELGVPIEKVAESGPGLAFIAYPQATTMMPLPQFWAVCFFIMIILLGLDTQFVSVEVVVTTVSDLFPAVLRRRRKIFLLLFCVTCFLLGLLLITEGGMYVFQLIDYYGGSGVCVIFLTVMESLTVGWIFGAERLYDGIKDMAGVRPNALFKSFWCYVTPLASMGSLIFYFVKYEPLTFNHWYVYPDWVYTVGWLMSLSSILLVPLLGIFKICTGRGSIKQRLSTQCHPDKYLPLMKKQRAEQQHGVKEEMEIEEMSTERQIL